MGTPPFSSPLAASHIGRAPPLPLSHSAMGLLYTPGPKQSRRTSSIVYNAGSLRRGIPTRPPAAYLPPRIAAFYTLGFVLYPPPPHPPKASWWLFIHKGTAGERSGNKGQQKRATERLFYWEPSREQALDLGSLTRARNVVWFLSGVSSFIIGDNVVK